MTDEFAKKVAIFIQVAILGKQRERRSSRLQTQPIWRGHPEHRLCDVRVEKQKSIRGISLIHQVFAADPPQAAASPESRRSLENRIGFIWFIRIFFRSPESRGFASAERTRR